MESSNLFLLVYLIIYVYNVLLIESFTVPFVSKSKCPKTIVFAKSKHLLDAPWFPLLDEDSQSCDEERALLQEKSVELMATLVKEWMDQKKKSSKLSDAAEEVQRIVKGRFLDLACTIEGERVLENMFGNPIVKEWSTNQVQGAVIVLQSLCIMASQTGVTGDPETLERRVRHLDTKVGLKELVRDLNQWDRQSIRRLKFRLDKTPAVNLLAALQWKRSPLGAFELLQQIGAYGPHENLALLRSGFPVRFEEAELEAANEACHASRDPDEILGIRRDLRHLKVFTIDSEDTSEIDDGLSVEVVHENGVERKALWVHIADADNWAPRNSPLLEVARERMTSLYLPERSVAMFPSTIVDEMSLKTNCDSKALSLRVLVNDDGSLDSTSVTITPSVIRVTYRLTYEDVDDMLMEGIGYQEEWELGALLNQAKIRREYRISRGSSEALVPNPVPKLNVLVRNDPYAIDDTRIEMEIEISHNAGANNTADEVVRPTLVDVRPVSSAYLLVTEAMILAGEAVGCWRSNAVANSSGPIPNGLDLPFRTQAKPDWGSRARERRIMTDLLAYNIGDGYCHAWYARRFFEPARINYDCSSHFGLGLTSYVQWSSPIRRFSDLQAHCAIKRFLRRVAVNDMLVEGKGLPQSTISSDLGLTEGTVESLSFSQIKRDDLDEDIDYLEGVGLMGVGRTVQRESQQYWIFEYIRRLCLEDPTITFKAVVLGCVDPAKRQFAIYVRELGLEHKYTSPGRGRLEQGTELSLLVENVRPDHGLLSFVRKF